MGINCAPLAAELFLFCYEKDFMLSLSDNNLADVVEAFNSTSRYQDDLLNIDNPYFEQMSQFMRFQTMWFVRPAKPPTRLRIRAV